MENKLNREALETYANDICAKWIAELFAEKEVISGSEILAEIPIKQVALLIIKDIHDGWSDETKNLESPYFNYKNEAVQQQLKKLLNILSKNILVSKADFEKLLVNSVEQTLLLFFSPYEFFKSLVNSINLKDSADDRIGNLKKFIKVNSHMLDTIADNLKRVDHESNTDLDLDDLLSEITEPPADVEELVSQFSVELPLDIDDLFENILDADPLKNVLKSELDADETELDAHFLSVSELQEQTKPVLNDSFAREEEVETLAEQLGKERNIGNIKSMLTINQRFMFINDLFDGVQDDFLKVIDFLDTCDSKEIAIRFIENNYVKRGLWNKDAPQVKEFIILVSKRFD